MWILAKKKLIHIREGARGHHQQAAMRTPAGATHPPSRGMNKKGRSQKPHRKDYQCQGCGPTNGPMMHHSCHPPAIQSAVRKKMTAIRLNRRTGAHAPAHTGARLSKGPWAKRTWAMPDAADRDRVRAPNTRPARSMMTMLKKTTLTLRCRRPGGDALPADAVATMMASATRDRRMGGARETDGRGQKQPMVRRPNRGHQRSGRPTTDPI